MPDKSKDERAIPPHEPVPSEDLEEASPPVPVPNVDVLGQIDPAVARKFIDLFREAQAEADKQRPEPVVRLDGEWLAFGPVNEWDFEIWGHHSNWSNPANPELSEEGFAGLLVEFVRLDGADDEATLAFARRWGQLGLCQHGKSRTHQPGGCPPTFEDGEVRERVAEWRAWVYRAHAIVELAAYDGQSLAPAWALNAIGARDWWPPTRPLDLGQEASRIKPDRRDPAYRRWDASAKRLHDAGARLEGSLAVALEKAVNAWLDETGVGVRLAGRVPYMRRPNVLGTLGWALLKTVAHGLVVACSLCHELYRPDRRPRLRGDRAEAPYCPKCRVTPEAKRDIAARYRTSLAGKAAAERRRAPKTTPAPDPECAEGVDPTSPMASGRL
jgi:hypothetical protein